MKITIDEQKVGTREKNSSNQPRTLQIVHGDIPKVNSKYGRQETLAILKFSVT